MKNLIFFSFLISLLLVFPGCSKDDDGEDKKTSNIRLNLCLGLEKVDPIRML